MSFSTNTFLPDFLLTSRQNQVWDTSGLDSFEECISKSFFKRYPYEVSYNFNSRGFRDEEWPETNEELRNSIWCFGDSFTAGLGCPYDSMWVKKLEKLTGIRTINISLDGASNAWISRKVIRVIEELNPRFIVIHWSYFDRRESPDETLTDEDRRISILSKSDYENNTHVQFLRDNLKDTLSCIKKVEALGHHKVIHSVIHDEINSYQIPTRKAIHKSIESICKYYIHSIEHIDYSRDGFHYGVQTSELFANRIRSLLY
jgi:hypothetical protein